MATRREFLTNVVAGGVAASGPLSIGESVAASVAIGRQASSPETAGATARSGSPSAGASLAADYWQYPVYGQVQPLRTVRIAGYPFEHQVRISLPPSYQFTQRRYPTLWVLDNALDSAAAALYGAAVHYAPELIVVSIGGATDLPFREFQRRRSYDFSFGYSPHLTAEGRKHVAPGAEGGGPRFRDYLVDMLRPQLAREYRMAPAEHALAGHSAGAMFALTTLFSRPEGFAKYLIISPGGVLLDFRQMEADYAKAHADLKARVFIAAGGTDLTDYGYAMSMIWTATAAVTEALVSRRYPSLELTAKLLPDQTHWSVVPIAYTEGVRVLWREQLKLFSHAEVEDQQK